MDAHYGAFSSLCANVSANACPHEVSRDLQECVHWLPTISREGLDFCNLASSQILGRLVPRVGSTNFTSGVRLILATANRHECFCTESIACFCTAQTWKGPWGERRGPYTIAVRVARRNEQSRGGARTPLYREALIRACRAPTRRIHTHDCTPTWHTASTCDCRSRKRSFSNLVRKETTPNATRSNRVSACLHSACWCSQPRVLLASL